jgi:hypothetical protein
MKERKGKREQKERTSFDYDYAIKGRDELTFTS